MSIPKYLIWLPAFSGIVLTLVMAFDLQQFHSGTIEVRTMLARELPIVVAGFTSTLGTLAATVIFMFSRQWANAFFAALSMLVFAVCFVFGGEYGAAYLNAT